jgi:hypothetical protein
MALSNTVSGNRTLPTDNCTPRALVVDDSCGCTLTKASFTAMTKDKFEAQGMDEVGMARIIAQTKEARLAGAQERTLTDLLLSRHVSLPTAKGGGSESIIAPFSLVPRRNTVNPNYFQVYAGSVPAASDAAITTGTPTTIAADATTGAGAALPMEGTSAANILNTFAWTIKVYLGPDPGSGITKQNFNKGTVDNLGRFFLPGMFIMVETNGNGIYQGPGADSDSYSVQMEVIGAKSITNATVNGVAGYEAAEVIVKPSVDKGTWGGYNGTGPLNSGTAAEKLLKQKHQPIAGTLSILANSVSDYEKWCDQGPAINDLNLVEYWQQTMRWTHCYNDEYLKALEAPYASDWFKNFRSLPLAQQRKQQEMLHERAFYNTVFYGQAINDKQTVNGYTDLPKVYDSADVTCHLEYKANTLGIRTQLNECGRVHPGANAALNIDTILEAAYAVKRERENTAGTVDTIDAMTDRFTAAKIHDIMIKYYKAKYSADITLFIQAGQKLTDSVTGKVAYTYNKYDIPDHGLSLAVFTDPYFDDRLTATTGAPTSLATGIKTRARTFWMIDWSDIAINIIKTNSVRRQTDVDNDIYNCVIQPNVNHYILNSKTFEVRVGNPNRHVVIENFTDGCPTLTVAGCDLS